ncbi:MAG: hypothetical protein KME30_32365, partial [Iphinoe sp. HA4291-MV1]|nr:hypothetical protein [Iphinoe sp. HA4291-MV1]
RSLGSNAETLNREQSIGALQLKMHVLSLNDSIPHFNPDRLLEVLDKKYIKIKFKNISYMYLLVVMSSILNIF